MSKLALAAASLVCVLLSAQTPTPTPTPTAQSDAAVQEANHRMAAAVLERIAGHESEPAGQVFKNVDRLKEVPARTLLAIMEIGYSRALGVSCTHCHVEDDYASDAKREKKAAREMQQLHLMINDRLKAMQNLADEPDKRVIN